MGGCSRNATLRSLLTFLQLHGEQVQPLHPLLQLVLGRGRHGVHILVAPVVVLVRVGGEDLQEEEQTDQTQIPGLGMWRGGKPPSGPAEISIGPGGQDLTPPAHWRLVFSPPSVGTTNCS